MVGSEYVSTIVRRFSWGHPLRFLEVSFCTRFLPDPEISSRLFQYSPSLFNPPPNPSCSHHYPPPISIQEIHSPWAKLRTINLPLLDLFQSFEIYCYFMNENILYHDEHHIYSSVVTQIRVKPKWQSRCSLLLTVLWLSLYLTGFRIIMETHMVYILGYILD